MLAIMLGEARDYQDKERIVGDPHPADTDPQSSEPIKVFRSITSRLILRLAIYSGLVSLAFSLLWWKIIPFSPGVDAGIGIILLTIGLASIGIFTVSTTILIARILGVTLVNRGIIAKRHANKVLIASVFVPLFGFELWYSFWPWISYELQYGKSGYVDATGLKVLVATVVAFIVTLIYSQSRAKGATNPTPPNSPNSEACRRTT